MINEGIFYILQNNLDIPAYLSDWAIGSYLNDNRKREYRNGFEIPYEEEIMYCRDTSFWNSADQGIVFTDNGIHFCWNNDDKANNSGFLPWYLITNAEYREDCLCFLYNGELCQINLDHCVKESDINVRIQLGNKLAYVINLIAQHIAEQTQSQRTENDYIVEQFDVEFQKYWKERRMEEATKLAYEAYDKHGIAYMLLCGLAADPENKHAIELIEKEYADWEDNEYVKNVLKSLYAINANYPGNSQNARITILETLKSIPESLEFLDYEMNEQLASLLYEADFSYVENLFNEPYSKRKLLMPVDVYTDLSQNQICVLAKFTIEQKMMGNDDETKNISFPMGHPVVNQLYVAHPLTQNHYFPFETYEIELIKDRIHEFCELMECLGATSISICYQQHSEKDSEHNNNSQVVLNGKVNTLYQAGASINQQETNKFMQSLGQSLNLHQTYNPFQQPFIPDNLIWYPQEPTWQRLVEQRLRGSITSHTESIETNKTQVINNDSLSEIQAELQVLLSNANLEISTSTSETLKQHDNVVLQIHVEFAPLWSLGQTEYQEIPSQESELTENEQEYLEMFQETLADGNGQITNSARNLLGKYASRLGITTHRATQLEQMYLPSFTTEEKEFIEEVRTVIDEDGELTNMSIRLLHKLATKLGISEQRAEELINIAT
jgi:hypothetical protein